MYCISYLQQGYMCVEYFRKLPCSVAGLTFSSSGPGTRDSHFNTVSWITYNQNQDIIKWSMYNFHMKSRYIFMWNQVIGLIMLRNFLILSIFCLLCLFLSFSNVHYASAFITFPCIYKLLLMNDKISASYNYTAVTVVRKRFISRKQEI